MSVVAEESFVVFEISKTQYGLSIEDIDKIYQVDESKLFHIPKSSPEILGLYQYKGNIVPVIDLSLLLKKHKIISKITKKGKETQSYLPSFWMKVKGISMIFTLPSKPDVIAIDAETRLEKKANEIIKSKVKSIEGDKLITELNLQFLFNNVSISNDLTSPIDATDDLDLSQYLLEEDE